MAIIGGSVINGCVSSSTSSSTSLWKMSNSYRKPASTCRDGGGGGGRRFQVNCVLNNSVASDPYRILRIHHGASECEVKKAFRQLALQFHPDVCKGINCGIDFQQINEAYDMVMSELKDETSQYSELDRDMDEPNRGTDDPDWALWEEWMGWEGAGIRDYSSHINPYI